MDSRNSRFGISAQLGVVCPPAVVPRWLSGAVPAEEGWGARKHKAEEVRTQQCSAQLCQGGRQVPLDQRLWDLHRGPSTSLLSSQVSPEQALLGVGLGWGHPRGPLQPKLLCHSERVIAGNRTCCPLQLWALTATWRASTAEAREGMVLQLGLQRSLLFC